YVLFEVPSNVILMNTRPSIWTLFSYYLIPDSAETASWLTKEERKLAVERLNDEPSHAHESYSEIHQIVDAFKDW
ncbi:15518_t:CDS:2, partial [Racocetra fulgida]